MWYAFKYYAVIYNKLFPINEAYKSRSNVWKVFINEMNMEPFVIERTLNAPISKIWQAITDKGQMKQWYFDLAEFKPEVGFEFSFEGKGNAGDVYVHLCTITEVVPGKKISHTWRYKGTDGNSKVTFELFPEGDKTRIKLTHEGLETFISNGPDFAKESFAKGWTYIIGTSLKAFSEKA